MILMYTIVIKRKGGCQLCVQLKTKLQICACVWCGQETAVSFDVARSECDELNRHTVSDDYRVLGSR